eukprot:CAMPEP_0113662092 /NCGR_PEP_ID=MMETSP0038_2-20120614/369_1 /TAXON_ID=2898 /ORGANISM="Cryptomonas paramecium" /LENGTH=77 /DNA_ID=CAMNT_0000576919 /DNA_START=50 /DNA_END=283 /DNA_ORIENTATION=+ /assembly_acc=CAM_ASM_000170
MQYMLEATPNTNAVGVCGGSKVDYSPFAQPCTNDFAKEGIWSPDNSISRMEHIRPGLYAGIKGGYDAYWRVPSYGNP